MHRPNVLLRKRDELCKPAVAIDADDAHIITDVHLPGSTRLAHAAADVAFGADTIANLHALHRIADLYHFADELVPGGDADGNAILRPVIPLVNVTIRAADSR